VHFSPILFLCAPVLALAGTPLALVGIQSIASACAVPAIYLIAKARVSRPMATFAALTAFTYPPFISMTTGDFHELAFATPVILWLIWALDARRFKTATVLAVVALTIKEDVTLVLIALAILVALWAWRRRDTPLARFCTIFGIAATCALVLYFGALRPALTSNGSIQPYYLHYYDWTFTGPTPRGYADIHSSLRLQYFEGVMVPMIALPLLTPAFLLAVPGLVEILASHEAITLDLSTHYVACWLPYIFFAFVLGIASVSRRSQLVAVAMLTSTLAVSLWVDIYASPANWWYKIYRLPNARDARLEAMLQRLPSDVTIGADLWIFAHLGLHRGATIDPTHARIVVVDRQCGTAYCKNRIFPFVDEAVTHHTLRLQQAQAGIEEYVSVARR
jgi:uncharacterized membrane protein